MIVIIVYLTRVDAIWVSDSLHRPLILRLRPVGSYSKLGRGVIFHLKKFLTSEKKGGGGEKVWYLQQIAFLRLYSSAYLSRGVECVLLRSDH